MDSHFLFGIRHVFQCYGIVSFRCVGIELRIVIDGDGCEIGVVYHVDADCRRRYESIRIGCHYLDFVFTCRRRFEHEIHACVRFEGDCLEFRVQQLYTGS